MNPSFFPRGGLAGFLTRSSAPAWALALTLAVSTPSARSADAPAPVRISGELRQWHKVTLTTEGPTAREQDTDPNPFTDYRMEVTFTHSSGSPVRRVPGYFAADGQAGETSATEGNQWRAHLSPDKAGTWSWRIDFTRGPRVALSDTPGTPVEPWHGRSGSFRVGPTDKAGRDFRARGGLEYVGEHHLRFAGSGEYFFKAGPDAPETLLAYADFDGTEPGRKREARTGEASPTQSLHRYEAHLGDWREGDPFWKDNRGKGLIGALNYLALKGLNSVSFLPYNVGGDGDNVWPFAGREDKFHYDCSKLDQWGVVFDHATHRGLFLHFKLQETEIDDHRHGGRERVVPAALDGGDLGPERRLYLRELIARFSHELALNWNLGEENTQSPEQQRAMAAFIRDTDPYDHLIVVHTYPDWQDRVYPPLLGAQSVLGGASLQNPWDAVHRRTLQWVNESARAGRPWVVANDEQNDASLGVPPDPGYQDFKGLAREANGRTYSLHDIRRATLWGNLMAGGAGVEYYFGYSLPQNDLVCEDWRSRDRSWDYCRVALEFLRSEKIPFWRMQNADALAGNPGHDNSRYVFALAGELYLLYLPNGGPGALDLSEAKGTFQVGWFNPRLGGPLRTGSVSTVPGGQPVQLGPPPADPDEDWLVVLRPPD